MTWLRIDDGFTQHPKVVQLARGDRWTWLDVLCYCARYRTDGVVREGVGEAVRGATPSFLQRCAQLGLLDIVGDEYVVHDWNIYNGATIDERAVAYLATHPQASANEAAKAIGGNRKAALAAIARYRAGSEGTTSVGDNSGAGGSITGSNAGSNTGTEVVTRARSPSPSPLEPSVGPSERSSTRSDDRPTGGEMTNLAETLTANLAALGGGHDDR